MPSLERRSSTSPRSVSGEHTQLLLGFFTQRNYIARIDLVGRDVNALPVNQDRTVRHHLACFSARGAETHAIDDIIQSRLQQAQEVFTGNTALACRFLVIVAELLFQHTVDTTYLLLFTQLNTVV